MKDQEDSLEFMPVVVEAQVPDVEDMPVRVQQILCLVACGFSPSSVARLVGVSDSAICQTISRYDPNRRFHLSTKERRAFISKLFEAKAAESLLLLTHDKMKNASASQLAGIASRAAKSMSELAPKSEKVREFDPYKVIDDLGAGGGNRTRD